MMTFITTPWHQNPYPRGHEIYNFGRPFLGPHYCIHRLSGQCLGVEKEIMHFHYMTYPTMPHPSTKTPAEEVMKFTILLNPSSFKITIYLVCLINAWEQRRRFL